MELGVDRFITQAQQHGRTSNYSLRNPFPDVISEAALADQVGLDIFEIGEHHDKMFLDSAPVVILSAIAAKTSNIRLSSAVTVLSAADPVRVFQELATLDLVSGGRAEIIVGRGSSAGAFSLFGYDLRDYDSIFAEKLDLLLKIRANVHVRWSGEYRARLEGQAVYPRPLQKNLPIWLGVGGSQASFVRAGTLGMPLALVIIGGNASQYRPLVDLYQDAGRRAGHPTDQLRVGIHAIGYAGATSQKARDVFFPEYAAYRNQLGVSVGLSALTRHEFDTMAGPNGPLVVGDHDEVVEKLR